VFEIYTGRNGGAYNDESAFHYGFSIATTNNFFGRVDILTLLRWQKGFFPE
jgi:hypothetical protein